MGDDDGSLRDEIDAAIGSGDQALVAGLVKRASPRRAELGAAAQALFAYATGLGIDIIRAAADGGAGDPGASAGPLTAPPASPRPAGGWDKEEITRNLLAGLTTSFAAIALGAAFGDACGRGALVGILSAGVIAFITATFGGTRVQCSGPTAPMTTITTLVVAYSRDKEGFFKDVTQPLNASHPGCGGDGGDYNPAMCPAPDRFVNIVMLLTAGLMVVMGVGRIGKYITLVPNVVISGFMNGIAVQIWQKQVIKLYGTLVVEAPRIKGSAGYNLLITLTTTVLCFNMPKLVRKVLPPAIAKSMPATLCVIAVVTLGSILLNDCVSTDDCPFGPDSCAGCIEKTQLGATIESPSDLSKLIETQMPTVDDLQTPGLLQAASLFALQLSVLCYLDTLLTSLVVDKMVQERDGSDETTNRAKELTAQGVANGVVATFGGLPGAQVVWQPFLSNVWGRSDAGASVGV
jgi:SulP family sulfate permease